CAVCASCIGNAFHSGTASHAQIPERLINCRPWLADVRVGVTAGDARLPSAGSLDMCCIEDAMLAYKLLALMPMLALLCYAAAQDLRTRKIRNWLTLCLVLTGIAHCLVSSHSPTLAQSVLG